ncbi:hypothetical protein EYB26_003792 [Talaromyces marneffei]|uniref:uncharacterized protein n=1 Tax=Talaromyces marneffei TaxID=37727 RepID=UPI0012A879D1|nr:uncharacterized protein EYB26_003792 [Talaromyces marneffei]QGA16125.1 hypothetical protein EYB26_003792 [Talaromyces marneffei]
MSSRRQYSSCDPCRRLKRKCVYEGATRRPGAACLRCNELGYNCTFDYVSTRVEQKKRKRYAVSSESQQEKSQSTGLTSSEDLVMVDWDAPLQPRDGDVSLGYDVINDNIVTDFLDLDSLEKEWQDPATVNSVQPLISDTNNISNDSALQINIHSRISVTGNQLEGAQFFGSWKGSPMQLLNTTFTAKSLGTCLYQTYATVMHGMESRYLDYECNPFGPSHRYSFQIEDLHSVIEDGHCSLSDCSIMSVIRRSPSPDHLNQGGWPESIPIGDSIKITFVGIAKFLDHFGHFYGNRLDRQSRAEAERMLIAAQQVFALQWAVSSPHGQDKPFSPTQKSTNSSAEDLHVFAKSWFKARSLISNATPIPSFTRVYAMLLFHMTVAPEEAKDVSVELDDILDQSLRQFENLKLMVDEYVKLLNSTSTYRNLLQSSVKAFQWFAYIKDTFVALLTDRDCILTENPSELLVTGFRSTPQPVDNFVDAEVPLLCQRAVLLIYRLLRQTANVKQVVRESETIEEPSELSNALSLAISFVEAFNVVYDGFRNKCMTAFETLSPTSKLSFGYLALFWSLGTLTLAEQIERASNSPLRQGSHFLADAGIKAKDACGDSGVKLPFILHHASLAPIVAVLSQSIDHIIQRIIDSETPIDRQNWMLSIKPVLTCLFDMRSTVAGTRFVQSPLNRLMASHGDLLMECWTVDDPDNVFD